MREFLVLIRRLFTDKGPIMKAKFLVCVVFSLLLFFSSCTLVPVESREPTDDPSGSSTVNTNCSDSLITRYDVYQLGVESIEPGEFNAAMSNNPISANMHYELQAQGAPSSTSEFQAFYSKYLQIWHDELTFSIDNLKTYLSDEETAELDVAQEAWEESLSINLGFDRSVISNHGILLGTQSSYSFIVYLADQYCERAIHIKYMTYLIETSTGPAEAHKPDQLWNRFQSF